LVNFGAKSTTCTIAFFALFCTAEIVIKSDPGNRRTHMNYKLKAIALQQQEENDLRETIKRMSDSRGRLESQWEDLRHEAMQRCTCHTEDGGDRCEVCDWWNMMLVTRRMIAEKMLNALAKRWGALLLDPDAEATERKALWGVLRAAQSVERNPSDPAALNSLSVALRAYEGD
jgi:hypothetical protein